MFLPIKIKHKLDDTNNSQQMRRIYLHSAYLHYFKPILIIFLIIFFFFRLLECNYGFPKRLKYQMAFSTRYSFHGSINTLINVAFSGPRRLLTRRF